LIPGERRQHLLQVTKSAAGLSVLLDVLAKQSLVCFPVEAFPTGVGAMLTEERMEFARENEPHATRPADPLDDAFVQQVGKPILEIIRQRLFTLDGIQYKDVPGAKRGEPFRADFLEKTDEGGILNFPAQAHLNLVIIRPREVGLRFPLFDGFLEHPVGALAGSLN
jgi:hypothetical protein